MRVTFVYPGHPVGKARARARIVTTRSGRQFAHHYTPEATRQHEASVGWLAQQAMGGRPPIAGPVRLLVIQTFAVPASWSRKQRERALAGAVRPTVKPDWDNLGKLVADALNGIVYGDDKQVASATVEKWYGPVPECEVTVTTIEAPPLSREHCLGRDEMPSLPFAETGGGDAGQTDDRGE